MSDPLSGGRFPRLLGRGTTVPATPMPVTSPSAVLSMYDAIHFGIDENGCDLNVTLMYRSLLMGGLPGAGKSTLINTVVAYGALCADADLWLFDGKLVELSPWRSLARVFVGNDLDEAITAMETLAAEVATRYALMDTVGRRKIERRDRLRVILAVIDELAYYTAIAGGDDQQQRFITLLLYVVAFGRAVGVLVVAATQRPSADIVPTKVRDIFGFRIAFRCATDSSSDIILANGWAAEGYSAKSIAPESVGVGLALVEGGIPIRFKAGLLTDADVLDVGAYATTLRSNTTHLRAVPN